VICGVIDGCLHDPANVRQTSSKCIQNTRANAERLLQVCRTFAGSCKHPITYKQFLRHELICGWFGCLGRPFFVSSSLLDSDLNFRDSVSDKVDSTTSVHNGHGDDDEDWMQTSDSGVTENSLLAGRESQSSRGNQLVHRSKQVVQTPSVSLSLATARGYCWDVSRLQRRNLESSVDSLAIPH